MKNSKCIKGKICDTQIYLDTNKPITAPVCWYSLLAKPWLPKVNGISWIKRQGKHQKGYLDLYCGFDIETTNLITEERKVAYMYIWQFCIASDGEGVVYLGRTWDEFNDLLDRLSEFYELDQAHRLIVWDANFGFEFQFIRKKINWLCDDYNFFAKEQRKPLLATTDGFIEFRECLSISGGSLKQLAKDYCTTQKLVGDLDYNVERNNKTKLTLQELGYCINDVVILAEFSKYIFEMYIKNVKLVPLTKTGLLRIEVKAEFKKLCSDVNAYKDFIRTAFPSKDDYQRWFKYLFRGGFVHSNLPLTNVEIDIDPEDITSSYPDDIMLFDGFPATAFKDDIFNVDNLRNKCCVMVVEFRRIRNRFTHSIESKHKAIFMEGERIDNGRIYYADRLVVMLTELDFDNYCKFYKWDAMRVISFKTAKRGKLPRFIREVIARHYREKAALKEAGKADTPEYALAKSLVNSGFGLMVTRIQLDKVIYNGEWALADVPLDYNAEVKKQILLPQWGIYVAAAARNKLLNMVYEMTVNCGNIVAYCDTDSIKHLPHPQADALIDAYNAKKAEQLRKAGLTDPAFHDLGFFDRETPCHFKTLGAKRYLCQYANGKVKATIAGLPKTVISKIDNPFEQFSVDGFSIKAELADKLTTRYNDNYHGDYIAGEWMEEDSSVALYEIPFTMLTDKAYYKMLIESVDTRSYFGGRVDG